MNLIKPDFVVPNGFLFAPNGSISLSNHDTVPYADLPTDGVHAIDTGIASRPSNGDPSNTVTLATASNYDWYSYGFGSQRGANVAGGRWVPTGSLHEARWRHTATLLQNGKVLIVGGLAADYVLLDTAELYDPATGTWSAAGRLNAPKSEHSATLLPSGMVLVVGFSDNPAANAELYQRYE